jgi:hypothetical protein
MHPESEPLVEPENIIYANFEKCKFFQSFICYQIVNVYTCLDIGSCTYIHCSEKQM